MDQKQIQKSLRVFTQRVKTKFKPEQIVLFGSFARGKANKYSDVDVVVIANTFKSIPEEKRLDELYPLTADLSPDFHVFGYTPEEFAKISDLTSITEAKTQGIPLL